MALAAQHQVGRRSTSSTETARPRIRPAWLVWSIFGAVLVATMVTYGRLSAGATYHFNDSGLTGSLSRAVAYLAFPVSVAAIAAVWTVRPGLVAWVVTVLCGTAFVPGVVSSSDLTARWADAPAAIGVAVAVAATVGRPDEDSRRLGRARWCALGALALLSVPWLIASVGLYAEDLPLIGRVLMSRDPTPGNPELASVHLGLHDGMFGAQLAAAAIVLSSRSALSRPVSLYISLMLVYGSGLALQDAWSEQIVKRGWSSTNLPDMMQPSFSVAWLVIIAAAFLVDRALIRREPGDG